MTDDTENNMEYLKSKLNAYQDNSETTVIMDKEVGIDELDWIEPDDFNKPKKKYINEALNNYLRRFQKEELCLKNTMYNLSLSGPFLKVLVKRELENIKNNSIEATITFPISVQAAVYHLSYEIDGRIVKGIANNKKQARDTYEEAISEGKSSVLHEELIRGVHMLSIGNIPAKKKVSVTIEYLIPIVKNGMAGQWIIPVTIGQIYGDSPFSPSDDFVVNNIKQYATVQLSNELKNLGVSFPEKVLLDHAIIINLPEIKSVLKETITGINLGEKYTAKIMPSYLDSDMNLSLNIVCDHSGSMEDFEHGMSRYTMMLETLKKIKINNKDDVQLWQFANDCVKTPGNSVRQQIVNQINMRPSGGTEIQRALNVVAKDNRKDILVITDGKTYNIDIDQIIKLGRRISVVFVGDDALEATLGYVATVTGGQIFYLSSVNENINNVLSALRKPYIPVKQSNQINKEYCISYGGIEYFISLDKKKKETEIKEESHIIANMLLPYFTQNTASNIATLNNLVSNLTSIVLVDDKSSGNDSFPESVKIPLMSRVNNAFINNASGSGPIMSLCASGSTKQYGCAMGISRYASEAPQKRSKKIVRGIDSSHIMTRSVVEDKKSIIENIRLLFYKQDISKIIQKLEKNISLNNEEINWIYSLIDQTTLETIKKNFYFSKEYELKAIVYVYLSHKNMLHKYNSFVTDNIVKEITKTLKTRN